MVGKLWWRLGIRAAHHAVGVLRYSRASQPAYVLCLPALQYASRVRTIKNDVTKNENSKEMLKLKKMVSLAGPLANLTTSQECPA